MAAFRLNLVNISATSCHQSMHELAARVSLLSTGHGRTSDEDDALSVAVVSVTSTTLPPVQVDAAVTEFKLLTEYHGRSREYTNVDRESSPCGHEPPRGGCAQSAERRWRGKTFAPRPSGR